VKVKGEGLRVYSRRGYLAREDKVALAPASKQEQLLGAIKSPLARRDIELDLILLYKAAAAPADKTQGNAQASWGAIDINLQDQLRFGDGMKMDLVGGSNPRRVRYYSNVFGQIPIGNDLSARIHVAHHNHVPGVPYAASRAQRPPQVNRFLPSFLGVDFGVRPRPMAAGSSTATAASSM